MTDLRTAAQQALEALEVATNCLDGYYIPRGKTTLPEIEDAITALKAALAEPVQQGCDHCNHPLYAATKCRVCGRVQEPVECEPQYANEDGWCEWVCPKPVGYLMQCCDCGLIHEVESRVAKYEPLPSEMFEVVDDPDLQAQWRMKRRDDISPKQAPQRPAEPLTEGKP